MQLSRWIALISLSFAAFAQGGAAPKTEELQGGRWVPITSPTTQPTDDPTLREIEQMIERGQYRGASKRAIAWLTANNDSPLRDRALFLNAEALSRAGNRIKAFYYLDELMDSYPESRLFYPALEKQFEIADRFLPDENRRGYKSRFFGMAIVDRESEAVEMLYRIQQRSPGSILAERALLRSADYYYFDEQYDLAGDAYGAYAKAYPRSPLLPRVKLKQAYANLAQFRGAKYDATPAIDARAQLNELIALYPELAQEENLPAMVEKIDAVFAEKLLRTGNFYRRTNELQGAVYTYRYLIKIYPDSPEAGEAQAVLDSLPAWALDGAPPGIGPVGLPSTTQPSARTD